MASFHLMSSAHIIVSHTRRTFIALYRSAPHHGLPERRFVPEVCYNLVRLLCSSILYIHVHYDF